MLFMEKFLGDCMKKHEKDHFDDIPDCPACEGLSRPGWKKGKKPADEEAHAGCIEIKCLDKGRSRCRKAPDPAACYRTIQRRINFLKNHPMYGRDCYP